MLNRPGIVGGSNSLETGAMTNETKSPRFSPAVRERAVRMVGEHAQEPLTRLIAALVLKMPAKFGAIAVWPIL